MTLQCSKEGSHNWQKKVTSSFPLLTFYKKDSHPIKIAKSNHSSMANKKLHVNCLLSSNIRIKSRWINLTKPKLRWIRLTIPRHQKSNWSQERIPRTHLSTNPLSSMITSEKQTYHLPKTIVQFTTRQPLEQSGIKSLVKIKVMLVLNLVRTIIHHRTCSKCQYTTLKTPVN